MKKENKKKISLDSLEAVSKLLILQLIAQGLTSETIGKVLGIDSSTIRHMVPVKEAQKSLK